MLCKGVDETVPFYCLARGADNETTETFYKLIFNGETKRAYLSFPMTAVADMEDVRKEIDHFRKSMAPLFICFDPGDLEEAYLPHRAQRAEKEGLDYVKVNVFGDKVRLDLREVRQIERDINSQTYARDFMLIDQSDMIISFVPSLADGRAAISSGVERELQHAHEAAKEVYVVWTAKQQPSVFVTQTATRVFDSTSAALEYFQKYGCMKRE
jgi:hypothetical protein